MFCSVVANQRQPQYTHDDLQRRCQPRLTIIYQVYILRGGERNKHQAMVLLIRKRSRRPRFFQRSTCQRFRSCLWVSLLLTGGNRLGKKSRLPPRGVCVCVCVFTLRVVRTKYGIVPSGGRVNIPCVLYVQSTVTSVCRRKSNQTEGLFPDHEAIFFESVPRPLCDLQRFGLRTVIQCLVC